MIGFVLSVALTWWIYVPIHELLHVLGCVLAGGSVSELQIDPKYGAALLAKVFPFVVSGGDYAGRLSGFDTRGSDLIYLATDFMPFLLTVVLGVPALKRLAHTRSLPLVGIAVVVGLAPFCSLIGDYYEMGSILATRGAAAMGHLSAQQVAALRSDDVFKHIGDIIADPQAFHLTGTAGLVIALLVITASVMLAVVLALLTYHAGSGFARLIGLGGPADKPADRGDRSDAVLL